MLTRHGYDLRDYSFTYLSTSHIIKAAIPAMTAPPKIGKRILVSNDRRHLENLLGTIVNLLFRGEPIDSRALLRNARDRAFSLFRPGLGDDETCIEPE